MPVQLEIPVAWGDMDSMQHVNNTVYLRWCESARIALFIEAGVLDRMPTDRIGPILARTEIDYREPLQFPDTVTITAFTISVGTTSFVIGYRMTNAEGAIAAEARTVIVMLDYRSGAKVPIDAEMRARLDALLGS